MRSKVSTGGSRATLRKFMIGFQMIIFIGLMMASVTIYRQMQYFHDKDLGFDKNDLIVLSSHPPRIGSTSDPSKFDFARFLALKSELESDPFVVKVSGAQSFPGTEGGTFGNIPVPSDPSRMVRYQELSVDRDFVETMKMQMVSGESFARAAPEESKRTVIVNESAINALGFADLSQAMIQDKRILGVVRDFNFGSLHQSVPPMVIRCDTMEPHEIAVRVRQGADREKALSSILQMSAKFNNGTPMSFQFFDDRLDDLYGDDYRFGWMIGYFTALAIFITCLGLFGVSLFTVHTRVKEVGIRKVMGASAGSIFYLLAREFIILTLGSALVAVPVSILFINRWLENYAYKVGIDVVVVLKVTLLAIAIVVSTIVLQVFRAARANPVEALRCE